MYVCILILKRVRQVKENNSKLREISSKLMIKIQERRQ